MRMFSKSNGNFVLALGVLSIFLAVVMTSLDHAHRANGGSFDPGLTMANGVLGLLGLITMAIGRALRHLERNN